MGRIISINWGPWAEAGMAKVGSKAYEVALAEGDRPLPTAVALSCLAGALRASRQGRGQRGPSQFCACDVDWSKSSWSNLRILELVHDADDSAEGAAADA